jgi:two-component system cell cycle sensor histidine kinase PleC
MSQSYNSANAERDEKIIALKKAVSLAQEYTNDFINDLVAINEELMITRDYTDAIIRTVRGPLLVLNDKLRIVSANSAFYKAFKVLARDTENKLLYDLGNQQWNIPKLRELLEEILPEKNTIEDFVVEHNFKDIGQKTMLLNAQTLKQGYDKTHPLILLAIEDITERTLLERERLTKINSQRNELIKLNEVKNEFTAIASHQLRTPATIVKQYISLLLDGYTSPLDATQRNFLKIAYESNEHQLTIINDLLKTALIDSSKYELKKEFLSISKIVQETITAMLPIFESKNQHIEFISKEENTKLLVDRVEMKLVFNNLLVNASKYSYPDSIIKVCVGKKSQKLIIEISDNGVGISKENTKRIFEKFTRINNDLSDTVTGSGLGLYWVQKIVKLHKGTLKVKSTLKVGSTFIVSLPI